SSLGIAFGEAAETVNRLYKLRHAGFLEKELVNARVREGMEIQQMLNGLIRSIRDSDTERRFSVLCALCLVPCALCLVLCAWCFLLSTQYSVLCPLLHGNVASCYLFQ
ncbi:MAG: four helix bundle protein, partial [bacterium]